MIKIFKKRIIIFVMLFFCCHVAKAVDIPYDDKWLENLDNSILINHDTTWNGDITFHDPARPIRVVDGATLTIEAGTHIKLSNTLVVNLGRIVAIGTPEQNIIFDAATDADLGLDPDRDMTCEMPRFNGIEFSDHSRIYGMEASIMRYVKFQNLGVNFFYPSEGELGKCQYASVNNFFRNFFGINSALAHKSEPDLTFAALNFIDGTLHIDKSSFENNYYSDIKVNAKFYRDWDWALPQLEVSDTNLGNNYQDFALISIMMGCYDDDGDLKCYPDKTLVQFINNWYGDASGPIKVSTGAIGYYYPENGKQIAGNYTLDGWSTTRFKNSILASDDASNILFIPGIKTSRLYDDNNDRLWPPHLLGNDAESLMLDEHGKSKKDVHTKDIIDSLVTGKLYDTFFKNLEDLKDKKVINDYKKFAYDWRESVEDVASDGVKYPSGEIDSLVDDVRDLSDSSKSGRVTVIAHSNGGLVAKALMLKLQDEGLENKVDKIIFVGTPQMGTPFSILTLLYGYDEEILGGMMMSQKEARDLVLNMPGAYGLLPSEKYLDRAKKPLIKFASPHTKYALYQKSYGDNIDNFTEFKNFLLGSEGRAKTDDIDSESILNRNIFSDNTNMHDKLDDWIPPASVEVYQLAGWGLDTISGVNYTEKEKSDCVFAAGMIFPSCGKTGEFEPIYEPSFTADGDKIVVAPSALMLANDENVRRYWVNLYKYNNSVIKSREHKDVLEIPSVNEFIEKIIKNKSLDDLPDFISASRPSSYANSSSRLKMSLYSPLDINLYDDDGNHTGPKSIVDEDGNMQNILEENIPNSSYYQLGERKYVIFPEGVHIRAELDGYDMGSYTLKLEELYQADEDEEEKTISSATFDNLPTTSDTLVKLDIPVSGISGSLQLQADTNSDGQNDYVLSSVVNGTTTLDDEDDPNDETHDKTSHHHRSSSGDITLPWHAGGNSELVWQDSVLPREIEFKKNIANVDEKKSSSESFIGWWRRRMDAHFALIVISLLCVMVSIIYKVIIRKI